MGSTERDARKGVAKPATGSFLNNKIRRLTLQINELELLTESLQAQGWQQRQRQEILLTLLMNQEELQRIFKSGWPASTEGAPDNKQQQQQLQQQQARGTAAPTWNELLTSAPAWQVHRCLHQMRSCGDWSAMFTNFFTRATPLLELASRGAAVSGRAQANGAAAAAAAAAADTEPPWEAAAQCSTPDVSAAARQELRALMRDVMQLSALACLLNLQPMRDVCFRNHLTGQLQLPPPGHWQQVAARLQMTPQQLVIMRFIAEAMSAAVQQEVDDVSQLCSRAARLSLNTDVEQREQSSSTTRLSEQQGQQEQAQEQEQPQQQPPGASASSSEASSGAPATSKDTAVGLMRQLKRATDGNNITMSMVNALAFDTLSPLQWATATIAGFPFCTTPYGLASASLALADQGGCETQPCPSARLLQQDAEQHMLQRREQLRQRLQEWRQEPKHRQLLVALQLEDAPWLFG